MGEKKSEEWVAKNDNNAHCSGLLQLVPISFSLEIPIHLSQFKDPSSCTEKYLNFFCSGHVVAVEINRLPVWFCKIVVSEVTVSQWLTLYTLKLTVIASSPYRS